MSIYVKRQAWEGLPAEYRWALETATAEAGLWMLGTYDGQNPGALRRLVTSGTQLRPFPREVMAACAKQAFALYDEIAATNPKFAKIYTNWKKFRDEEYLWLRVAEQTFDIFVLSGSGQQQKGG